MSIPGFCIRVNSSELFSNFNQFLACIRFFGNLTKIDPETLTHYPQFADEIFDMVYHFDQSDVQSRQLAFETLTIITQSAESKRYLSSQKSKINHSFETIRFCQLSGPYKIAKAMNHFGVAVALGPAEARVSLLESLSDMFSVAHYAQPNEDDAEEVLNQMFRELGEPFPKMLCQYISKPFDDLKCATLSLLCVLVKHEWALKLFIEIET